MFKKFYPDYYIDSVYALDYQKLYDRGIRGVIYDIDNTLVWHDAPADTQAQELFERLRTVGLKSCLLSNNDEPRVKLFAEAVGADAYIYKAGKPGTQNYLRAVKALGCVRSTVVFAGDQLFTDVWGARRAGITSCLVKPLGPEKLLKIRLKRILEKPVLAAYACRGGHCIPAEQVTGKK